MLRRFSATRAPRPRARARSDSGVATASPRESAGRADQGGLRLPDRASRQAGLRPGRRLLGAQSLAALPRSRETLGQRADLPTGEVEADGPELLGQPAVAAGGVGLALEGLQVAAHLLHEVAEALEVDRRRLQAALGLLLALAVLEDPGRLLDDGPPVLRPGLEDGVEAALADDHVLGAAHAGVGQQLGDVEEPARLAVDGVARLAVLRQAAGDRHLAGGDRDEPRPCCRGRDTSARPPPALRRAGKDDVVHLAAHAERPLGAEHPGHGVDDVRLARAVGADDHGDAGLELERRRSAKDLKPLTVSRFRNIAGPT